MNQQAQWIQRAAENKLLQALNALEMAHHAFEKVGSLAAAFAWDVVVLGPEGAREAYEATLRWREEENRKILAELNQP